MISFLVRFKIPVILLFFACQFLWFKTEANLLNLESITLPAVMSLFFLIGFWLFILFDMINSKIFNKTFWLISMLIMPNFAPAVYLFQRKKLQRIRPSLFIKNSNW